MKLRVMTAAVGIPLVLALNEAGGLIFVVSVAVVALLGGFEGIGLIRRSGGRAMAGLILIFVTGAPFLRLLSKQVAGELVLGFFALALLLGGLLALKRRTDYTVSDLAISLFFIAYIGLLLQYLPLLRVQPNGNRWVLIVLLLTWAYDTGGFLVGRSVGRTPFMHHISPRKTWEGVLGGMSLCVLTGFLAVPLLQFGWWQTLPLSLAGGLLAQSGDLIESFIKRQAGVKDSGNLLPGHGGILDRIDGLLLVAPAVYFFGLAYGRFT